MIANSDGLTQEEEERRCEQVAQLLLEGMKGEELAKAVRDLDRVREEESSNSRIVHHHHQPSSSTNLAMPIPMSSFHNPFGLGGFGYSNSSSLSLPPSAYIRRPSSVPLPPHNSSSDFFSFDEYSHHTQQQQQQQQQQLQALDLSAITLPSVPFITRPSSPINNISRQHQQQRNLLGQRRASSAQPVFRRSWTLPINPTPFTTHNDFSGFDCWTRPQQVQRDESPLPEVDPEFFNGFSFDHQHQAIESTTTTTTASLFSTLPSSTPSSVSDRNSPSWLDTSTAAPLHHHQHTHSRSHSQQQHLAIAPHDLPPPLHVDMNWHNAGGGGNALATTQSSSASSSSSSAFPSPSPPLPASTTTTSTGIGKSELEVTPTNEMFELSLGYDMGMDMNGCGGAVVTGGVGGVEYGYTGYGDLGYGGGGGGGEMGLGLGLEMGYAMGVGVQQQQQQQQQQGEMGMWSVVGGQAQQA